MCKNDGVNHVIAQSVNHVSLDKIAAATVGGTTRYTVQTLPRRGSWQGVALTDEARGAA